MIDQPYFMTNEEWYYFDYIEKKYKITNKAPKQAQKSYNEYYNELRRQILVDKNGRKNQEQ